MMHKSTIKFGADFKEIGVNDEDLNRFYINPNQFQTMNDQLHVCETLFGDFNAKLMILLQDAADEETLNQQCLETPGRPLRHSTRINTNKKLVGLLRPYFDIDLEGKNARNCGVYYANAVWLIKRGSNISSPIHLRKKVQEACVPVLRATIANLSDLRLILAFGKEAFESLKVIYGLSHSWSDAINSNQLSTVGNLKIGVLNHPRASVLSTISQQKLKTYLSEAEIFSKQPEEKS